MKRRHMLLLLVGFSCLLFWSQEACARDAFDRGTIYQAHFADTDTGVYIDQDDFFIVVVQAWEGEPRRTLEMRAMLEVPKVFSRWALSEALEQQVQKKGVPSALDERLALYSKSTAGQVELRKMNVSVTENRPVGKNYRYALSGDVHELYAAREEFLKKRQNSELLLRDYLKGLAASEDLEELKNVFTELGVDFLAVRFALSPMQEEFSLVNYAQSPNVLVQRRWDDALHKKNINDSDLEKLAEAPAHPDLMRFLYSLQNEKSPEAAGVALLANAAFPSQWGKEAVKSWSESGPESFLLVTPYAEDVSSEHVVALVLSGAGFFFMGDSVPRADSEEFKEARELFRQGAEVSQIKPLLIRALQKNPANQTCWDYLAALFKAKGHWRDAASVYQFLLMFDPFKGESLASLAECYCELGFVEQGKWTALAAETFAQPNEMKAVKSILGRVHKKIQNTMEG
ncbi:hypothetical protein LWC08_01900 [Desulfobaculum bizertense]|uniref:tetratricopeptide repeat protein n=1 Tax=Desulfobaculum bizertense TaxID=376490 RepID=UPI001F16747C|nr:hypothetical protein [Desulfobaculum bizertense]UIJ38343.1 hypothetical protein LWC08_01900 [Desulfobaculum bizertense]